MSYNRETRMMKLIEHEAEAEAVTKAMLHDDVPVMEAP
jgi:hypothetical protein